MISQQRMEKALKYLAETDEEYAYAKTHALKMERKAKSVFRVMFLAESGTVAEREAKADKSNEYQEASEAEFTAKTHLEHIKAKRDTEALVIDVWRSLNASQRRGNVV